VSQDKGSTPKRYLFVSDFDQTLSFNDSGIVLSEMLGISGFQDRIAGLSRIHLVQQGGELAYLLLHDPEYRRIHLKEKIRLLSGLLNELDGLQLSFYIISAAPEELIQSALEEIVPPDHIFGTRFHYHPSTGEIESIDRVPAGYGKVAVLEELRSRLPIGHDRIIYVGDGSSDVHVMLHVNRLDGLTIAVSENKYINQIARRTVLSDNALSVFVPILEDILGWTPTEIRTFFDAHGFLMQEWDKVRTDSINISKAANAPLPEAGSQLGAGEIQ